MSDDDSPARRLRRVEELRSRRAHDNPHWPVSNPANAGKALEMHCDCDYSACATLVAAVIVSREDYRSFRRIEITGDLEMPTLGSGA
ncbi:hypothetical protein ABTW96_34255 [Nocardia beijingensis]|uniref:hypothetical protein n=1 Tax=Nocardia beijingensis TaxID=95162 RepID=UPI00332B9CA2